MTSDSPGRSWPQQPFDASVPQSARVWNYWLGGKDNFAPDRELGDQIEQILPGIRDIARESRLFLTRAVRYLVGDVGIRQFLDIGAGLPATDNTHTIAQILNPDARVVYVDNDPLVLAHARALLTGSADGITACIEADIRDPDRILHSVERALDLTEPIGLMMLCVLGHIEDYEQARASVDRLVTALPPGSYVVVSDGTNVVDPEGSDEATRLSLKAGIPYIPRHPDQIAGYVHGLELVEPGVVSSSLWRSDPGAGSPAVLDVFCGVARKQ
ncbi:SAM-dependent methyltransferase [Actinoplanes subglobosus]|uniref:SAM-dependent methyltransferase n=1 Tax=Actinoplanes subglobosus TaxID=1547892 RepID=A0ABV8JA70_9ACTN